MIKRNTIQRVVVLDTVIKLQCHATADEIYEEIIKAYPSISRATVYRNLQQLSEMGEIRKVEIPGSPDRYDHVVKNHYHARCIKCGRIIDLEVGYMKELEKSVKDTGGFVLTGHNIVFDGICPECQAQTTESE